MDPTFNSGEMVLAWAGCVDTARVANCLQGRNALNCRRMDCRAGKGVDGCPRVDQVETNSLRETELAAGKLLDGTESVMNNFMPADGKG
ncbi:hypothetical protein CEXT_32881 [Caerostris extrusa]|uniref:Uncharacterized protein n=1 Tax=Caerostris extrusa TaxID=172846 RepID=A0AAV4SS30_CAEEX|nr:hypothetical protein CEXT_32881 [Caerostris extrusa]